MARVSLTPTERQALEEAVNDAKESREQLAEAVAAGLQPQDDLDRLDAEIGRAEAAIRIYG